MAPAVPGFLAATARAAAPSQDGRVLVIVQLDGGNDGINTVVPYNDEGYAKNRQALRLSTDKLHKVNDAVGLHPSLTGAAKLLERGELAIVQGVGYPNPSRSHFRSMAIWQTARHDPEGSSGGRRRRRVRPPDGARMITRAPFRRRMGYHARVGVVGTMRVTHGFRAKPSLCTMCLKVGVC
jgi:uncharacterized protein (DUF1501 family)